MIPTSPRSLRNSRPDSHPKNYQHRQHRHSFLPQDHRAFEWSPPDSDSDGCHTSPDLSSSNHRHLGATHISDIDQSDGQPCERRYGYFDRHYLPESQLHYESDNNSHMHATMRMSPPRIPLLQELQEGVESTGDRCHSSMVTATMSPIRSSRRITRQQKLSTRKHKRDTEGSVSKPRSRKRGMSMMLSVSSGNTLVTASHNLSHLPPTSLSNKIYVRIKRIVSKKRAEPKATEDKSRRDRSQFRSDPTTLIPCPHRAMVSHHCEPNGISSRSSVGKSRDFTALVDSNDHNKYYDDTIATNQEDNGGNVEHQFDDESGFPSSSTIPNYHRMVEDNCFDYDEEHHCLSDRFLMTQRLLAIENGPIPWASIAKRSGSKPPTPFVWYLTDVLEEAVQVYLTNNVGKEYWIKHVVFWSDLLDPGGDRWNTDRGSRFQGFARQLHTYLQNRWGAGDSIECHRSFDQTVLVQACILFARKNTSSNISSSSNNNAYHNNN